MTGPAQRLAAGWVRRADWSDRVGKLGPPDPSQWGVHGERPRWIPSPKVCDAPRLESFEPDGQPGDLWRCPDCGLLWAVVPDDVHSRHVGTWELLGRWRQLAYRRGWWRPDTGIRLEGRR